MKYTLIFTTVISIVCLCNCNFNITTSDPAKSDTKEKEALSDKKTVDNPVNQATENDDKVDSVQTCGLNIDIYRPIDLDQDFLTDEIEMVFMDNGNKKLDFRGPAGYKGQAPISLTIDAAPEGEAIISYIIKQEGLEEARGFLSNNCDPQEPKNNRTIRMEESKNQSVPTKKVCALGVEIIRPIDLEVSFLTEDIDVEFFDKNGNELDFRGPNGYKDREIIHLVIDEAPEGENAISYGVNQQGLRINSGKFSNNCDPKEPKYNRRIQMQEE